MFVKKSEVAILVSNENNSFVKFLSLYFNEKKLLVKIFNTRNSLYLHLLTHNPEVILVSRQIKSNNHKQVINWISTKYKITTVLFDESAVGELLNTSFLKILDEAGAETKVGQDICTNRLNFLMDLSSQTTEVISQYYSSFLNKGAQSAAFNGRALPGAHHMSDFISSKLDLSPGKVNISDGNTYLMSIDENKVSGYVVLDTDNDETLNNFNNGLGVSANQLFKSESLMNKSIKRKFLGSIKSKGNIYSFDCQLPEFNIIENEGKLELNSEYFVYANPVNFDVYILMGHQNSDYHYLSPGSSFSREQLSKLKTKSKKVRVNIEDRSKLMAHLNFSHMIKLSSEV